MNSESPGPTYLRDTVLLAWIAGTALFFFLRFSLTFYNANEIAIRTMLNRVFS